VWRGEGSAGGILTRRKVSGLYAAINCNQDLLLHVIRERFKEVMEAPAIIKAGTTIAGAILTSEEII